MQDYFDAETRGYARPFARLESLGVTYTSDPADAMRLALASEGAAAALRVNDGARYTEKKSEPALRGNHGWFVESPTSPGTARWFVRKGRGMTVRKAMPRDFLDRLEESAPLDPRTIRHDFQTKEHALAAWYARTYDGSLWKVWRSNRDAAGGIRVERVED